MGFFGPRAQKETISVYQHSDLLYWWAVWAYGYFCAFLTWTAGIPVVIGDEKAVKFFPGMWLGFSYVAVLLFVLVTTSAKAKGVFSLVLFLILGALAALIQYSYGWMNLFALFSLALIHMNLAFYVMISTALLGFWLLIVFGIERFKVWTFGAGTITVKTGFLDEEHVFRATAARLKRIPDDLVVHKILGLAFLGFGTGDIEISFDAAGGRERHELKNVWRATAVARKVADLLNKSAVTTAEAGPAR